MKAASLSLLGTTLFGLSSTERARADGWLVAETPIAFAVSDAQQGAFRPGIMPAFGAYMEGPRVALGLRMRAGVLRNGPDPGGNLEDPGLGGLATASAAARLPIRRGWVELALGGGVTGGDLVPAVEAGAGWQLAAGAFDVGPSVRYVRVVSRGDMASFGSADLLLAGIDVRFGRPPRARTAPRFPVPPVPPPVEVAPAPPVAAERDPDEARDRDASCIQLDESCPLTRGMEVTADRIVLPEHVMFERGQAALRPSAREVIARLARLWTRHPEWLRVTVEGHACELGPDDFNQDLSLARAQAMRQAMIEARLPAYRILVEGHGRSRPRDPGHTEEARARNRRVEFVIERGEMP